MNYQPVWRDGHIVTAGERDCADRYEAVKDALTGEANPGYAPFTVLDLGAAQGYFATRLAEDFDCQVTAIDFNPVLEQAASARVHTYVKRFDARSLRRMARHDVVLALSVLHHFVDWRAALRQIRACRQWAIIEVPHPDEKWLRSAPGRKHLRAMHDEVAALSVRTLGHFERTGRDGSRHLRPMYLVPGTVTTIVGSVFAGSGTCSRRLPEFGKGLDLKLGYTPFAGSLNLRTNHVNIVKQLGEPSVDWNGRKGARSRRYLFWDAWVGKTACHAMDPAGRNHGPECIEVVASTKLRAKLNLLDDSIVAIDVEKGKR